MIRKKIWPDSFDKVAGGDKKFELRLADFELKDGDTLILEEYDPEKRRFTGRKIEKKCKSVAKVNPMDYYGAKEIKKHGLYVICLE